MHGVYNAMRRIGLRRVLPLVFTLVHVVLVWYTLAQRHHAPASAFRDSGYRAVAYQEGVGVPMETLEAPPLNPVQKVSIILDLPAMFLATLIGAVRFRATRRHGCISPFRWCRSFGTASEDGWTVS
jgi:hypothetical protein